MSSRDEVRSARGTTLWRSFGHAWDGLTVAAAGERNMRIHVVAGVLSGCFAALAPLPGAGRALLVLCTAMVIAAEGANTAIEALVDLHGGAPSALGRVAKDAAAGAVLALAAGSVLAFAVLLAGCWQELLASARAWVAPAAASLGLAAAAAALLSAVPRSRYVAPPALAAGVILVTFLAGTAACPLCVTLPGGLLALAAAGGRQRRRGHQQ